MFKKKSGNSAKKQANSEFITEKLDNGYIHFNAIIEMMGAPKEYVINTLKMYVDKLKTGKDIIVIKEFYAKPKKHEKLFSTFVELEMLAKNASAIAFFCFDYMPSSIEIIQPTTFTYNAADFSGFFNDIQARMHRLDMVIKTMKAKLTNLEKNSGLLLRNNILTLLKENKKSLDELSRNTGIPAQQLSPFLERIKEEGWLIRENDKYSINKKKVKMK